MELVEPELKRAPRGYPLDHPRVERLRLKNLTVFARHELEPWLHEERCREVVRAELEGARPLVDVAGQARRAAARRLTRAGARGARPAGTLTLSMERKSITTSRAAVACDVCGRTLLRGEHADAFIANGSRRMVCELCTARAANEGWIREGADNALGVRRNGPRGGALAAGPAQAAAPRRAAAGRAALPRASRPTSTGSCRGTRVTTPAEHDEHVVADGASRRARPTAPSTPRSSRASRATSTPCRRTPT